MDLRLELVLIPVSDVDRAKAFYEKQVGFHLDVDHQASDEFRVVQLTPPGSACSITMGIGITDATPGSVKGVHLCVDDIVATRDELLERGVVVDEIHHYEGGQRQPGPDPERSRYNSFSSFTDPDGNTWVLQEAPKEQPST
jgi:catechol 2,3-dioxygenase-like lactoylglutathione lyase family enzyme